MKEDDLINKLENAELPEVELPSHKSQLKMALLKSGHSGNVLEMPRIKKVIITMKSIFMSKQPVWRTALVGILAMALVVGLLTVLPSLAGQQKEELVAEIIQNNSQFMAALGGEEITELKIMHASNNKALVAVAGTTADFILEVDFSAERINYYSGVRSNMTDEEKTKIWQILNTDPRTQSLLDEGAAIKYVLVHYASSSFYSSALDKETNASAWIALILDEPQLFKINDVTLSEEYFNIHVDLVHEEISPFGYKNYGSMTDEEIGEILNILKADPRTKALLDEGAVISSMEQHEEINVNVSVDAGTRGDLSYENSGAEVETVVKMVKVTMYLGDKYYRADVDVINAEVLSFGEVESL